MHYTIPDPIHERGHRHETNRGPHRLRLGAAEWIGLAALALTPTSGFTWWGYQMSERVTAIEVRQENMIRGLDAVAQQFNNVARLDERIKALDERLNRLDSNRPGPAGTHSGP